MASLSDSTGFSQTYRGSGQIFRALRAENIGVNVHYIPVHLHPYYRDRFGYGGEFPVAEDAYERLISLPMFHAMTDQDAQDVIDGRHKSRLQLFAVAFALKIETSGACVCLTERHLLKVHLFFCARWNAWI